MSSNVYGSIILTTKEWFDKCLEKNCSVFHFQPNRTPKVNKLSPGSICLILIKSGPESRQLFVGEFTVKDVKLVKGSEFSIYASRAIETPEVPFPRPGEESWIIEFENMVKYERPVKLRECIDIKTSSSKKPLSEWLILGFTLIKPVDVDNVVGAIRKKAGYKPTQVITLPTPPRTQVGAKPSHDDLVRELLELGEWLEFVAKKEEQTPDNVYRLDVVWRRSPEKPPMKAFEVELSHNIDKALARLKHAYDVWNCQQLWLIVSDETRAERAKKLVEPRLKGSFARIRDRVKIMGYEELHNMYTSLKPYKELLTSMSKRL